MVLVINAVCKQIMLKIYIYKIIRPCILMCQNEVPNIMFSHSLHYIIEGGIVRKYMKFIVVKKMLC